MAVRLYSAAASATLFLHLLFILWVVLGAAIAYRRPLLRALHILSLIWAILIELLPWPCPLTLLENWFELHAGIEPYRGGFLLHYLNALVYPDISATALTIAGVTVCALNFAFYGFVFARSRWVHFKPKRAAH
jgi:hypothetical protein